MKIPCAKQAPFVVAGLSFLQPALTNIQFDNLILIAGALVLGARFCLTEIIGRSQERNRYSATFAGN